MKMSLSGGRELASLRWANAGHELDETAVSCSA